MKNPMLLILILGGLQWGGAAAAKCTNATLQGTVVTAYTRTVGGALASTMYLESWDGAGNLQYLETDSNGTTTAAPYYGTGTYTIGANCIATVYYDGDTNQPWSFYIDENGSGYSWVNTLNIGIVAASQTELITTELLVNPPADTGPCSNATLKGTMAFGVEKTKSGALQASAGLESYDGAGNLHYEQTNSDGNSSTKNKGTGTVVAGKETRVANGLIVK